MRSVRANIFAGSIPPASPSDIITWAESRVRVNGGRSSFSAERVPQLLEPIRAMADIKTRVGTLVKPVQVGGSTAGEVVCAFWAAYNFGLIQYNWENDEKAASRWKDRILPTLESCRDIKRTGQRFEETICESRYSNTIVRCQGVYSERNLDSDTVPLQINEEIHSWKPGFLSKARRRQTQVWNAKAFDISNAGLVGDQLQSAYDDGTAERWHVKCPTCGSYSEMIFRWDPKRPERGGLRWDSAGCKLDNGRFDYNKLAKTLHYQFGCGHTIRDVPHERSRLVGKYVATNEGADGTHRSWTFDAVSCHTIPWLVLVKEWHTAIRAIKNGDNEPMRRFITERECRFFSDDSVPYRGAVVLSPGVSKSREGLPDRCVRLWAADKQRGYRSQGELSHYWLVIRDVKPNCDSRLVFEGKIQTETDLIATIDEHAAQRFAGVVDASWDTKSVMEFCYRTGCNAVMSSLSHQGSFAHQGSRQRRFYSEPFTIHDHLKVRPRFNYVVTASGRAIPATEEPVFYFYNKAGLLKNFFFLRDHAQIVGAAGGGIAWEIPQDVSEDYKLQIESWERVAVRVQKTKDEVEGFERRRKDDHLLMCEAYIAMLMDIGGLLPSRLQSIGIAEANGEQTNSPAA